jgi:transcriptional regulator with XRE-family HTH domain
MSNIVSVTENEWMTYFGEHLRELIADRGLTQYEVADASGISEASISCYIRGIRMPTAKAIINLALILEVDTDELLLRDYYDRIK